MTLQTRVPHKARQHLQTATTDQHQALDSAFVSLDLQNRDDYRRFLLAQAAVVVPLEAWLARQSVESVLPDWPARQRTEVITEDLTALDAVSEPDVIDMSPFTKNASAPALLGITYVLEGSRLGAQYLSRIVSGSPDVSVRNNMRFLEHGTGRRLWPSFLQTLEATIDTDSDSEATDAAADAARQTFEFFLSAQRRHAPVLARSGT